MRLARHNPSSRSEHPSHVRPGTNSRLQIPCFPHLQHHPEEYQSIELISPLFSHRKQTPAQQLLCSHIVAKTWGAGATSLPSVPFWNSTSMRAGESEDQKRCRKLPLSRQVSVRRSSYAILPQALFLQLNIQVTPRCPRTVPAKRFPILRSRPASSASPGPPSSFAGPAFPVPHPPFTACS